MGADQNDVSPIFNFQTPSNSKCAVSLFIGGNVASYKSVSTLTLQDQIIEKETEIMNFVMFTLPALKTDLFSETITSDDHVSHINKIMEQVKQLSSEKKCMKNNLNVYSKNTIYLKNDKVRHDHAITSLKIDVDNCSDLIKKPLTIVHFMLRQSILSGKVKHKY